MAAVVADPAPPSLPGQGAGVSDLSFRGLFRGPAKPLALLFVLYPLWWLLGFAAFAWLVFAVPMGVFLLQRRPLRFPPWFVVWLAFLAVVSLGIFTLGVQAPNTLPVGSVTNAFIVYALRLLDYLALTVILLYAGNLDEEELPSSKLVLMLGVLFGWTALGGLLGMALPHLEFDSPVQRILQSSVLDSLVPGPSLANNELVGQLTHVTVAQSQELLGAPRPSAPFEFTNSWGNNYAVLIGWFVIAFVLWGTRRRRFLALTLLAASVVPAVYSQNRGMWLGLVLVLGYLVVRLVLLGRYGLVLGALAATAGMALCVFLIPPLDAVITGRINNPHSNEIRGQLARQSWDAAVSSPIVGYGTTRQTIGSGRSAAIGRSAQCPQCGNRVIGSTGQLWLLLISNGLVGTALYLIFFAQAVVRYWRDHTWIGIVGVQALLLTLFFSLFYVALVSPLAVGILSLAVLWRRSVAPGPAS
jgi:hypothetical protein